MPELSELRSFNKLPVIHNPFENSQIAGIVVV